MDDLKEESGKTLVEVTTDRIIEYITSRQLKPGDKVAFTDIDGVRYEYEVTTQYHLKKWDQGENELQLCYETTDDDTYFVVGCGVTQN